MAAGSYALLGTLWIVLSDEALLLLATDTAMMARLSQIKGAAFIALMALIVGMLVYRIERRSRDLARSLETLREDHLTGLPNRVALEQTLAQQVTAAGNGGHRCVLLLVNVVNLARINTSMSRSDGDQVLCRVAQVLRALAGPGESVMRFESDTFAVAFAPPADAMRAHDFAGRLFRRFADPVAVGDLSVKVNFRVGLARWPRDANTANELLDAGMRALHVARHNHDTNRVAVASRNAAGDHGHLKMEAELRDALEQGAIRGWFQPQVSLHDGRLVGAEVLARWVRPDGNEVMPAAFMPVAEATGLIHRVSEAILRQTLEYAARWSSQHGPGLQLSVNLSALDLQTDAILDQVRNLLRAFDLPGDSLMIEVTESRSMENPAHAIDLLRKLRNLGVGIAMDDFGTGFSSLGHLTRFPIQTLKIDRSFVRRADLFPDKRTMLDTICRMGKALDMQIVAEGVETSVEAQLVADLGCDQIQGFLVAPALPPAAFEARFLEHRHRDLLPTLQRPSLTGRRTAT